MSKGKQQKGSSPFAKSFGEIVRKINALNVIYGTDYMIVSEKQEEMDRKVEGAKILAYSEQYACDISCITLHEQLGFGPERIKKYNAGYIANYREQRDQENEDKASCTGEEYDTAYADEMMERRLKQACGQYYEPADIRYQCRIVYNGKEIEGTYTAPRGVRIELFDKMKKNEEVV